MTVEELQLFANQLDTLPAIVSGRDSVVQLLEQVEKFQESAKKLLNNKKNDDLDDLNKIIETGSGFDIDLPELEELKQKAKRVQWIQDAKDILDDPMAESFDHIKEILETGMELPPSPQVERILGKFK